MKLNQSIETDGTTHSNRDKLSLIFCVFRKKTICYAQTTFTEIYESACTSGSSDTKFLHIPSTPKFNKKENKDKITVGDSFECTFVQC